MASSPTPPANAPEPRPGLLASLAQKHKTVAVVLFAAAAAFLVIPIVQLVQATRGPQPNWANALSPLFFWAIACAGVSAVVAAACLSPAAGRRLSEVDRMRLLLLILGSAVGILTALLGMFLPFSQGYSAVFAGGAEEWRKNMGTIYVVAAALLGGLGLAFASLQLARGVERENALMRRLLYGFSTVFTALLLVAVLLLINLLPYIPSRYDPLYGFLNTTFDWTEHRLYSLSQSSHDTLAALKEPIKAYVFLDSNDPVGDEAITLLQNARAITPELSWETVSSTDRNRIKELATKYKEKITQANQFGQTTLRDGILLVYGEEPKEQATFVPRDSLVKQQFSESPGGSKEFFVGEGVLLKAIRSLTEGKFVVYFTQGDGELVFNGQDDDGLSTMQQNMNNFGTFDMKPLKIGPDAPAVPTDADVVVVARPGKMKPETLKALADYMGYDYHDPDGSFTDKPGGRKGRLMVLAGVALANKQMVHSGLEPLLAKLGVQLGDDRVLSVDHPAEPTILEIQTNPTSPNPVAKAFGPPNQLVFIFDGVRTVSPVPGGATEVDDLAVTAGTRVWVEKNLEASPDDLAAAKEHDANARYSPDPVGVAVAVSDRGEVPNDTFHTNVAAPAGGPRLVVFGAADWASNGGQFNNANVLYANYNLFTSCVSWLRGEPDIGAAPEDINENKVRERVEINFPPNGGYLATVLLPAAHMLLLVLAAGVGVWLVRRR